MFTNLLIVAVSALAGVALGWFAGHYLSGRPRRLEVVTAAGRKINIEASELTREKVAEITDARIAARAY